MRPEVACWYAAATAIGSLLAVPSHALTGIRFERWFMATSAIAVDTVSPVDSVTNLSLTFDAVATALDVSSGFRFAIAERDPDGNDILVEFELPRCSSYPAPGSPIMVRAGVDLYCDAQGRLHARGIVGSRVQWCDVPQVGACQSVFSASTPMSSEPEAFELVALDEDDHEGSFPSPENELRSRASGTGQRFDVVAPDFPDDGLIGVFADPGGTLCSATIVPGVPFRWYLVARLAGFMRCGGVAFLASVHGMPPEIFYGITSNPPAVQSGAIFGAGGAIAFSECELGEDDVIVLATIDGISNVPINEFVLETLGVPPPISFDPWPEPFTIICPGFPDGFERRVHGSRFVVNPAPGNDCDPTMIEATSWQRFKALYR